MRSEPNSPARRGHKKETTCGFLLLVNLPLSLRGHGENRRDETAPKRGTAEDFFFRRGSTVCSHAPAYTQCQILCCYTGGSISAGATQGELPEGQEKVPWGIPVSRNSFAHYYGRHLRILFDNSRHLVCTTPAPTPHHQRRKREPHTHFAPPG